MTCRFPSGIDTRLFLPGAGPPIMETPAGPGTRLELTHEMPADAADYAEQTRRGWSTMLALLERTLE